jgi:hypothetical protein
MTCPTPDTGAGTLPFTVDSAFIASGWEGDYLAIHLGQGLPANDATCGGHRSSNAAKGTCYKWTYDNVPFGAMIGTGATALTAQGFGAVEWNHPGFPSANFGTGAQPGYVIPAGATKVVFYAKGAVGGEVVSFGVGQIANAVCNDAIIVPGVMETLTANWTKYTIPLPAGMSYASGQIVGFGWSAGYQTAPGDAGAPADGGAADGGTASTPISFFVDDIEWQ